MSFLRKLLGSPAVPKDPELERRAQETSRLIEKERQQLRQNVQRVDSAARLMETWDGAMKMMRNK